MVKRWALWIAFLMAAGCGGNHASDGKALVVVNGQAITKEQIGEELKKLPPEAQQDSKEDAKGFVERIVRRTLLLQEARKRGLHDSEAFSAGLQERGADPDQLLILLLAEDITKDIAVTEEDFQAFVQENRDRLPAGDVEALRPRLESTILSTKRQTTLDSWIEEEMGRSNIVWNTAWVKAQEAAQADNPLDRALASGRPVVADFGRGQCIPCKMMQPILETLAEEYKGKAEVLIIEIDRHRSLTRRSHIRLIPTQIFFDASGAEVYRHEGFMDREAIVAQLEEMGVR